MVFLESEHFAHFRLKIAALLKLNKSQRSYHTSEWLISSICHNLCIDPCHYSLKVIYLKDSSMCKDFALIRKSRIKYWLGNQVMKMATLCVFLPNLLFIIFSLEQCALQLHDEANGNTVRSVATQNVSAVISTPREVFLFWRVWQDEEWPNPNLPQKISWFTVGILWARNG